MAADDSDFESGSSASDDEVSSTLVSESESERSENVAPVARNSKKASPKIVKEKKKVSPKVNKGAQGKGNKSKMPVKAKLSLQPTNSAKKRVLQDSDSEDLMEDDEVNGDAATPVPKNVGTGKGPILKKKRMIAGSDDDGDEDDVVDEKRKSDESSHTEKMAQAPVVVKSTKKSPEKKMKKSLPVPSTKAAKKSPPKISSASSSSSSSVATAPAASIGASVISFTKLASGGAIDAQEEDITRGPEVTTENAAKKLILRYLKQQNRPYSAIQVFDNLHKRVTKGTTERVLDSLAKMEGGGIQVKEYGKNKIYWPDQKGMPVPTSSELRDLDGQIKAKASELSDIEKKGSGIERSLKTLLAQPSDADLDRVLEEKERVVSTLQGKADALDRHPVDPKALYRSIRKHNFYRKKWLEWKNNAMDIVENIAEAMEKKGAAVAESLGVETDKELGVVVPAPVPEPK
jgi:26S proteasome regulatory subunit (ATPase 3-interacting protein)